METNVCTVCLCKDRSLKSLGEHLETYQQITYLMEVIKPYQARLCWECLAVLHRCKNFLIKASQAQKKLQNMTNSDKLIELKSFSTLITAETICMSNTDRGYNYDDNVNVSKDECNKYSDELDDDIPYTPIKIENPIDDEIDVHDSDPLAYNSDHEIKVDVNLMDENIKNDVKLENYNALAKDGSKKTHVKNSTSIKVTDSITKKKLVLRKISAPPPNVEIKKIELKLVDAHKSIYKVTNNSTKLRPELRPKGIKVDLLKVQSKSNKVYVKTESGYEETPKSAEIQPLKSQVKKPVMKEMEEPTDPEIIEIYTNTVKNLLEESLFQFVKIDILSEEAMRELRRAREKEDHYAKSSFKCEKCVIGFYHPQQLEDHNTKHLPVAMNRLKVLCSLCGCYVPEFIYRFHFGGHKVCFECTICGHTMLDTQDLKRHFNKMHLEKDNQNQFNCNECGLSFTTSYRRQLHRETHHQAPKDFICDQCGKHFKHKVHLEVHVRRHFLPQEPTKCEPCNKVYRSNSAYLSHLKYVHNRPKDVQYHCKECNLNFISEMSLKSHLTRTVKHANQSSFREVCHICGKGFMSLRLLKDHEDYSHKGKTQYICQHCNKMFSSKCGLYKHIQVLHMGKRKISNLKCALCDKLFKNSKTLKEHQNVHTGLRPYKCDVCGATFKQSAALFTHKRLVHLGYKIRQRKVVKCN